MTINAFLTIRHGDFARFKNFKSHFDADNTQNVAQDVLQTIYKNDKGLNMLN